MYHVNHVIAWIAVFAVGMITSAGLAQHQHGDEAPSIPGEGVPPVMCPVMGEPANLALSVATEDGPVFFCCKDCMPKFKAEPQKYTEGVAEQRRALAGRPKIQVTCPVSGEPVDTKVAIDHEGAKVHFCCKDCIDKFKAAPDKYKVALANGFTYQTRCPVTDETIDPKAFTTLANGAKVYFCCKGCEKKLFADAAKYAPKLAAQGVNFDPKALSQAPSKEPPAHDHEGHDHKPGHDH